MALAALAVPAVAGSSTYVTDWRTYLNSDACRARLAEEHAFMSASGRPTGLYCKSRPVLYSPSQRLAYVKTPKSASLAIQDLFQKQFTDYRWAQAHEDLPDDTFTFTFVREPLKRAMSAYAEIDVAYALRASPESHAAMRTVFDKVNRKPGPRETPRVLAFLDDLLDHRFGGDDREHWMPTHAYSQLNFICNHRIDFIGHLENQEADWQSIQEKARIPPAQRTPFPHAHDSTVLKGNSSNTSAAVCNRACQLKAADQHAPMTPQLQQRICDVFASDFMCLGYAMPAACERPRDGRSGGGSQPAAEALNATLPLAGTSAPSPSSPHPAPVYFMEKLDADAAWHLLRQSATYSNSLFVVPCATENRSNTFRFKRAENLSFAPATSSDAKLLRDFDRFGWYWRSAHDGGGVDAAAGSTPLPRAPLAAGIPVLSASGRSFLDATAEARLGVDRAMSEVQQQLLLHRYDRVVIVGHGLTRAAKQGDGGDGDGGGSKALARYIIDGISRRLVDPLTTAKSPLPSHGHASGSGAGGNGTPHKHFLPGRR